MAGPMSFDGDKLSPAKCDREMDRLMHLHAIEWHRGHPPESIPASVRKDM